MRHSCLFATLVLLTSSPVPRSLDARDCNHNGLEDGEEVLAGTSRDCNLNSIPDECDLAFRTAFSGARTFIIGSVEPKSVEAGDLDGDGDRDLVVANGASSVSILWNDGGRGFRDSLNLPAGKSAVAVAVPIDADGDGRVDLAVGNAGGVLLLRNESRGSFKPSQEIRLPRQVIELRVADLDGDRSPDLAGKTTVFEWPPPDRIFLLLNNGQGEFSDPRGIPVEEGHVSFLPADLDGDGRVDLAMAGPADGEVTVLWNGGTASFDSRLTLPVGRRVGHLESGDLDGDGDLDLAGPWFPAGQLLIIRNEGGRTFRSQIQPHPGPSPLWLVASDLDGDSDLDLAGLNWDSRDSINILWNRGDGTFPLHSEALLSWLSIEPRGLRAARLDGDDRPELVFVDRRSRVIGVLWNNGDGTLREPETYSAARSPVSIAASDLDGDGEVDLATANLASDNVSVLRNSGGASFLPASSHAAGKEPRDIAAGDLDGDGRPDLAIANGGSDDVSLLWNRGDASFSTPVNLPAGVAPASLALGDLDGDGDLEVVTASEGSDDVRLMQNLGNRVLEARLILSAGDRPVAVGLADLDGDGDLDAAAANRFSNDVAVFLNRGGLQFEAGGIFPVQGDAPVSLAARDLDGDRAVDLVTLNRGSENCSVLWNEGPARFGSAVTIATGVVNDGTVRTGDLDGDGDAEIVVARDINIENLMVIWNGGSRNLSRPVSFLAGSNSSSVVIEDLNRDGSLDLAVTHYFAADMVTVLLNRDLPPRSRDGDRNGIPDECDGAVFIRGDANDDGRLNISDPQSMLGFLFLGGDRPWCLDAPDANDDGLVNLTDPVFTLSHLFLGGPEPPPPGPLARGLDGTPTDPFTCGDPPGGTSAVDESSTLPGVHIDLSGNPRRLALDQAAQGVTFRYTVVIERAAAVELFAQTAGGCINQAEGAVGALERVHGNGQLYCLCDVGLCPGESWSVLLNPGRYEWTFEWNGLNWGGPSDYGAEFGPPFPPGKYSFEVESRGRYHDPDGVEVLFEVKARLEFELVP